MIRSIPALGVFLMTNCMCAAGLDAPGPYAPSGEYVKDHSIIQFRDGTWHLFSISGTEGTTWTDSSSEECFSHSVSLDLSDWRFLGHALGTGGGDRWNASKVWAPHIIEHDGDYWMFYTGVRTGGKHIESIGIAKSTDLRHWVGDERNPVWECQDWGTGHENLRPCRDPMVFRDEKNKRWVLYYTTYFDNDPTKHAVGAAVSADLIHWEDAGPIIKRPSDGPNSLTESCFVIERDGRYYAFLNDGFSASTDPLNGWSEVRQYASPPGGFAGELFQLDGRWLRSVVVPKEPGKMGLSLLEVRWDGDNVSFAPFNGTSPAPPPGTGFVTARGRNFRLDGELFYPYGTYYHPLYAQPLHGEQDWFTDYRPAEIERDLDMMEVAGINTVRIMASPAHVFRHRDRDWATWPTPETSYRARLHDFLDRCGQHGIRIQMFSNWSENEARHGPIHLFHLNWDPEKRREALDCFRKLITECDLASSPNIFSFEIDWEPRVGGEKLRNTWPGIDLWNRWVRDTYGSVDEAVRRWEYPGGITTGETGEKVVSAPLDSEIRSDGPWTKKSAAYRRFIEDMVNRRQAYVHRAIRRVDPNHMITAQRVYFGDAMDRMTQLEYPTRTALAFLDYVGFTYSPHITWSRHGADWYPDHERELMREGCGTAVATDGRPIIFTEYGRDVLWNGMENRPGIDFREASQAEHIRWMHKIALDSGAAGIILWWWQGRRPMNRTDGEVSDWGVIRPDGSPRPAYDVLRKNASLFESTAPIRAETFVPIHPYAHAAEELRFEEGKQTYAKAKEEGGYVEFRNIWRNKTSRDVADAETGDEPIPLAGLNGLFYSVEAVINGRTEDVWRGREFSLGPDDTLTLNITVANTGDALWLADKYCPDGTGAVRLDLTVGNETREIQLDHDLPRGETYTYPPIAVEGSQQKEKKCTLTIRMTVTSGGNFGEELDLALKERQ